MPNNFFCRINQLRFSEQSLKTQLTPHLQRVAKVNISLAEN